MRIGPIFKSLAPTPSLVHSLRSNPPLLKSPNLATMSKHSEACCQVPPVVSKGYEPKGKYVTINGLKTYVTGPSNATQAILSVYDVFGFFPQTLQGADILAHSDKEHQYQVYMPDFFEGESADISWYPPDNKEKEQKLGNFLQTTAAPPLILPKVFGVFSAIKEQNPHLTTWGMMGYCWGAKIVALIATKKTAFSVGVQVHPAKLDPADAEKCTIPMCVLASKDEPVDTVKKYGEALTTKKYTETFDTQIHGWMAARADLEDEQVKKEYERGYQIVLTFFHDNLPEPEVSSKI